MDENAERIARHEVADSFCMFHRVLVERGAYPMREMNHLFDAVNCYVKCTAQDNFIHKGIAGLFKDFLKSLTKERKRIPGKARALAVRIETLIFHGYDPNQPYDEQRFLKSRCKN